MTIDGIVDTCVVTSSLLYWVLFNCALVTRTRFEACRFQSGSFRGCTFVDCEFVDCKFDLDNLGSDCTIDDCLMAASRFAGCTWTMRAGAKARDITKTRWLGCTQTDCQGFEGMF